MRWKLLPGLFLLRRGLRELTGIREQLTEQNRLLARLADYLAPELPVTDRETVRAETGLSYIDPVDMTLVQAFVARTEHDTGHTPTDDEILEYLADEKTTDLHRRLIERDQEAERVAAERRH